MDDIVPFYKEFLNEHYNKEFFPKNDYIIENINIEKNKYRYNLYYEKINKKL